MPTHKPSSVSPLGAVAKDDRSTSLPDANLPAAELLATLRDGLNLDDPSQTASTALARDDARSSSLSDWSATGTNASVSDVENERFAEPQQAREWSDSEADTEKLVMTPRAALPPTEIATVSSGLSRDVPSEASSSDSDSTSQATPSHPKHTPSGKLLSHHQLLTADPRQNLQVESAKDLLASTHETARSVKLPTLTKHWPADVLALYD